MGAFCSKNNDGHSSGYEEEEEAHIHYRRPPDISNCAPDLSFFLKSSSSSSFSSSSSLSASSPLSFEQVIHCKRSLVRRTAEKEERLLDLSAMILAANFEQNREKIRELPMDLCQILFETMSKYHLIEQSHLSYFAPSSLTGVDLSLCADVDDSWLPFLAQQAESLLTLNLSMAQGITDDGLARASGAMHKLKKLILKDCTALNGAFLSGAGHGKDEEEVCQFAKSLVVLNLENCVLKSENLEPIGAMTALRELHLSRSLGTGHSLPFLRPLASLRVLKLGWCPDILDEALAKALAPLSNLVTLDISSTNAADATMATIARKLPKLEELCALGTAITNVGVDALTRSESIRSIDVSRTALSDSGFRRIARMSQLRHLNLSFTNVSNTSLAFICQCPCLETLTMDSCQIGEPVAVCLSRMKALRSLNLEDTHVGDEVAMSIKDLPSLRALNLSHTRLTDSGLKHIATLSSLEDLRLDLKELTDTPMRYIGALTNLKYLDLHEAKISDLGLAHLRSLRKLEGLEVCGGSLTDSCGKVLAQMIHLKYLNISRNAHISDEILEYLAPLVALEYVNLNRTAVSIKGLVETIPKLKSIQQLSIKNCQRIDESLAPQLVQHFPYLILKEGRRKPDVN